MGFPMISVIHERQWLSLSNWIGMKSILFAMQNGNRFNPFSNPLSNWFSEMKYLPIFDGLRLILLSKFNFNRGLKAVKTFDKYHQKRSNFEDIYSAISSTILSLSCGTKGSLASGQSKFLYKTMRRGIFLMLKLNLLEPSLSTIYMPHSYSKIQSRAFFCLPKSTDI